MTELQSVNIPAVNRLRRQVRRLAAAQLLVALAGGGLLYLGQTESRHRSKLAAHVAVNDTRIARQKAVFEIRKAFVNGRLAALDCNGRQR